MIIVMNSGASKNQIDNVLKRLEDLGFSIHLSEGVERTIIGAIGDKTILNEVALEAMPGVEKVVPILKPYKLVSRQFRNDDSVVSETGVWLQEPRSHPVYFVSMCQKCGFRVRKE